MIHLLCFLVLFMKRLIKVTIFCYTYLLTFPKRLTLFLIKMYKLHIKLKGKNKFLDWFKPYLSKLTIKL